MKTRNQGNGMMKEEDIKELAEIRKIEAELKCPHCKHGIQIEDRNCGAGYIQYKCCSCGYVEQYSDRLGRAITIRYLASQGGEE
jgi:transposase-like protein